MAEYQMTLLLHYTQNSGSGKLGLPTAVVVTQDGEVKKVTRAKAIKDDGSNTVANNDGVVKDQDRAKGIKKSSSDGQFSVTVSSGSGCVWVAGVLYCW